MNDIFYKNIGSHVTSEHFSGYFSCIHKDRTKKKYIKTRIIVEGKKASSLHSSCAIIEVL